MPSKKKSRKTKSKIPLKWVENGNGSFSLLIDAPSKKTTDNNDKLTKGLTNSKSNTDNENNVQPDNDTLQNTTDSSLNLSFAETLRISPKSNVQHNNGNSPKFHSKSNIHQQNKTTNDERSNVVSKTIPNGGILHDANSSDDGHLEAENVEDGIGDDEDDDFVNDLFPSNVKPNTSAEAAPYVDEPTEIRVEFFIDQSKSVALAKYKDVEHRIGFLDLLPEEYETLKIITQGSVYLNAKSNHIVIHDGKFHIKRIIERDISNNTNLPFESHYKQLNLCRIQFSTSEPFLAKYDNEFYFLGEKLYDEYSELLNRTKKTPGTAIRIGNDHLIIDPLAQTLEIDHSITFKNREREICTIAGAFDSYKFYDDYPLTEYQRYMICNNPFIILEVEPELVHSSIYDDCTEIYADVDFPFANSEKVQKISPAPKVPGKLPTKLFKPDPNKQLKMQRLKEYKLPPDIRVYTDSTKGGSRSRIKIKYDGEISKEMVHNDADTYMNASRKMIHLEEAAQQHYLKRFNQTNIRFRYHMDRIFYFIVTDDLVELAAAIEENVLDYLVLQPKLQIDGNLQEIKGKVYRARDRNIYIEIFKCSIKLMRKSYKRELYDIFFLLNRMPYQLQQNALDFIDSHKMFTKFINNDVYKRQVLPAKSRKTKQTHSFITKGTTFEHLNDEQQIAVKNIIEKVDELPYVLFGPPGTGKTRTLVATIEQIVRTTDQNILVCAMSNAACDEIADRLVDVLEEDEMYRFYARSYKHEKITARLARVSNYDSDGIFYPTLKFLYQFRVIICTLCSSGCFTRARKDVNVWREDHFSYIFIDECASAHETMCLVPIAGLCTSHNKIHAKIVLAGDPKQLDAVTRSDVARNMGHNTSWIERLCLSNLYSRKNGQFNQHYITQLVKNYRSHPEILRIPNELFYENALESCAKTRDIDWYLDTSFLPSAKFPMIFKSVQGTCLRSIEHSWYNEEEVAEIVRILRYLLPNPMRNDHIDTPTDSTQKKLPKIRESDIGVVTPYRKQRHQITRRLRRLGFNDVTVGTAEVFQGKEKPIMLISTVRSNGHLGFLAEPRRLNVVITRAKCLLVIIGDPHTLRKDANWFRVIEHCYYNNSFIQGTERFSIY